MYIRYKYIQMCVHAHMCTRGKYLSILIFLKFLNSFSKGVFQKTMEIIMIFLLRFINMAHYINDLNSEPFLYSRINPTC